MFPITDSTTNPDMEQHPTPPFAEESNHISLTDSCGCCPVTKLYRNRKRSPSKPQRVECSDEGSLDGNEGRLEALILSVSGPKLPSLGFQTPRTHETLLHRWHRATQRAAVTFREETREHPPRPRPRMCLMQPSPLMLSSWPAGCRGLPSLRGLRFKR